MVEHLQLSKRICQLREERKWTQSYLAYVVGVSASAVCKWESGDKRPELPKVIRMSDLFGVSVDYLLGRTDERAEDE